MVHLERVYNASLLSRKLTKPPFGEYFELYVCSQSSSFAPSSPNGVIHAGSDSFDFLGFERETCGFPPNAPDEFVLPLAFLANF